MNAKVKKVVTASQWKKKNLNERVLELPSGAIFKVKDVDLETMASRGFLSLDLLDSLMSAGFKVIDNQQKKKKELENITDDNMKEIDDLARIFAVQAVISPKLSLNGDPGSINAYDLDFIDVMFIFSKCVRGGAMKFAPFFPKRAPSNSSSQGSGDVSSETIRDNGDTKS